jgi:glutathione S-transferase
MLARKQVLQTSIKKSIKIAGMRATLFGLASSHPSLTGELMLRHKGIGYRRIDLMPGLHRAALRAMRFPGGTVPAVKLDGARLQGTRTIARALDAVVPQPRLFPLDPERRRAVEEAEAWGDEVLQPVPRRIVWNALKHDRSELATYLEGAKTGIPTGVAARMAPPVAALARRLNRATDENVRRDLDALPGLIDRVDELIESGVIGGTERNAADFQIATSVSLLLTMDDVRPMIEGRPAERLARELVQHQPGHTPSVYAT